MDTARADAIEAELGRLIARRASQDGGQDLGQQEELWKTNVRTRNAHRDEEMREAWHEYHQGQAARHRAVLEDLIARHEAEAKRYREPEGVRT